jgi:two-component system, OmpR family, sensor histidine kinase MprB
MTFRVRVVVASSVAVSLAIALACGTAFLISRHAIFQSVDDSLVHTASAPSYGNSDNDAEHARGSGFELILADGSVYGGRKIPVEPAVVEVARRQLSARFLTVSVGESTFREYVVPVPAGTEIPCAATECILTQNAAQVFTSDITGQRHQLSALAHALILLTLLGVLLAALLGYLAARAALAPLQTVTDDIEEIADTTNLAQRLDEGGQDELGRLRRTFNKLMTTVETSQRLQRQLVLDASHELRTPLTSLRTNAQVLQQIDRLSLEDRQQLVADMIVQVDELAALITDLGELSRGESSEETVASLRLDEIVQEAVDIARTHARTKDITIELTTSPSTVIARRDRLARAINNLLGNAIKFAPVGGQVRVDVRHGTVRVEDNGAGIPEGEQAFIFDRFWRSPSARSMPGSGLGLAIVAQVASEARGSIRVGSSDTLGGAAFTLEIPEEQ